VLLFLGLSGIWIVPELISYNAANSNPSGASLSPSSSPSDANPSPSSSPSDADPSLSSSPSYVGRLIQQIKASRGGLTLTVNRVLEGDWPSTQVELTVANDTGQVMTFALNGAKCTLNDDDGNSLPYSGFLTNSQWTDTIPAHSYRRSVVAFERMLRDGAAVATLTLTFQDVDGLGPSVSGITVGGIQLRPR
jgi:hypothetical protein